MKTGRRDFLKSIVLAAAGLMIGCRKPQEPKAELHHYGLYVDENGNETRYFDGKVYEGNASSFPLAWVDSNMPLEFSVYIGSDAALEDFPCDEITVDVDFVLHGQCNDRLVGSWKAHGEEQGDAR